MDEVLRHRDEVNVAGSGVMPQQRERLLRRDVEAFTQVALCLFDDDSTDQSSPQPRQE